MNARSPLGLAPSGGGQWPSAWFRRLFADEPPTAEVEAREGPVHASHRFPGRPRSDALERGDRGIDGWFTAPQSGARKTALAGFIPFLRIASQLLGSGGANGDSILQCSEARQSDKEIRNNDGNDRDVTDPHPGLH